MSARLSPIRIVPAVQPIAVHIDTEAQVAQVRQPLRCCQRVLAQAQGRWEHQDQRQGPSRSWRADQLAFERCSGVFERYRLHVHVSLAPRLSLTSTRLDNYSNIKINIRIGERVESAM